MPLILEREVNIAAWISFMLLVKISYPPHTCYPTKFWATRLQCVDTLIPVA